MQMLRLKSDVRLVPGKNRVLVFIDEGFLTIEEQDCVSLVGRLAPLLAHATPQDAVIESFHGDERDRVMRILAELAAGNVLVEAGRVAGERAASPVAVSAPNITFIGHATLLLQTGGLNILTDPWLFVRNKRINRPPYPVTFEDLPHLDYICISHEHGDHLHLPTLMRLDKRIPVIVPKIEQVHKYNRNLEVILARLGFERTLALRTWESFAAGDLKITRTPCHKAWMLTEQATWLLESPDLTVFCGCDMLEDEPFMKRLGAEYRVDVAFLPISGFTRRINQLPVKELLPAATHDRMFRDVMGVSEAVQATHWIKPRFAVGYANGGAYWYEHPEAVETEKRSGDFIETLRRENPAVGGLDLKPGDIWEHKFERVIRHELQSVGQLAAEPA